MQVDDGSRRTPGWRGPGRRGGQQDGRGARGFEGDGGRASEGEARSEKGGIEGLASWCLVRRRVESRSYLFKLQLGPLANVGVGIEGCDDATSDRNGIHLEELARAVACSRGVQTVTRSLEAE